MDKHSIYKHSKVNDRVDHVWVIIEDILSRCDIESQIIITKSPTQILTKKFVKKSTEINWL